MKTRESGRIWAGGLLVSLVMGGLALPLMAAKTTTFIGQAGVEGGNKFSIVENWSNGLPSAGDTLVVSSVVQSVANDIESLSVKNLHLYKNADLGAAPVLFGNAIAIESGGSLRPLQGSVVSNFNRESFYANCPKSILLSNWYYGRSFRVAEAKWHPPRIAAYADLDAAGFDQVPCATNWYPDFLYKAKGIRANDVNFPLTVAHCRGAIGQERLKGFMMTTWARTVRDRREHILHAIDLVGQSMLI